MCPCNISFNLLQIQSDPGTADVIHHDLLDHESQPAWHHTAHKPVSVVTHPGKPPAPIAMSKVEVQRLLLYSYPGGGYSLLGEVLRKASGVMYFEEPLGKIPAGYNSTYSSVVYTFR